MMREKCTIKQSYEDYELERECRAKEAQSYYSALGCYFHWKVDAIYEDKILDIIGQHGLDLIREFRLMEPCGIINGRKLYAL